MELLLNVCFNIKLPIEQELLICFLLTKLDLFQQKAFMFLDFYCMLAVETYGL